MAVWAKLFSEWQVDASTICASSRDATLAVQGSRANVVLENSPMIADERHRCVERLTRVDVGRFLRHALQSTVTDNVTASCTPKRLKALFGEGL